MSRDTDPFVAACRLQPALDALTNWAHDHAVQIAADKYEAVVITTNPAQVNGKCRPPLYLNLQGLRYNASPKILEILLPTLLAIAKLKDSMGDQRSKGFVRHLSGS